MTKHDDRAETMVAWMRQINQRLTWVERRPQPVVPTPVAFFAAVAAEADVPDDMPVGAVVWALDTDRVTIQEAGGRVTMSSAAYLAP